MAVLTGKTTRRRGMALVETAIALPLLLYLILGLIEYGWMFLKAQEITNAARQGARVGARADAGLADITAAVANAMNVANIASYQLDVSPGDVLSLEPGQMLTVTVTVNYADDLDLLGMTALIPGPSTLDTSVTMAKEGT